MRNNPTVCAVMLVNGREPMVKRAIKCFREQTYPNKLLTVCDNSDPAINWSYEDMVVPGVWFRRGIRKTIGEMRNSVAAWALDGPSPQPQIFCHWDSDDWSHPRRIEEQVSLLQVSGKQCVGYRDMIFYDTTPGQFCGAWLYRHATKPLGTSLCYWRSIWEARPFPDLPKAKGGTGEDVQWLEGVEHWAVSSLDTGIDSTYKEIRPRMIASIHGGNTQYYNPPEMEEQGGRTSWRRATEFDEHCRKVMAL